MTYSEADLDSVLNRQEIHSNKISALRTQIAKNDFYSFQDRDACIDEEARIMRAFMRCDKYINNAMDALGLDQN